jgi:hypothetical protein
MKRRKAPNDIKTRLYALAWEQLGGYLHTAQAVSGVKVARAWSWVLHGTCEADPAESVPAAAGADAGEAQAAETARARVPVVESVAGRPE